jgi:hypothetical protein
VALPDADLERIAAFAEQASPAEHADLSRLEYEIHGQAVTLLEVTKLDLGRGEEWLRTPLARLTYDAGAQLWTLHCFDRDSHALRYDTWEPDFVQPTTVDVILAEIDADPTNIFWG